MGTIARAHGDELRAHASLAPGQLAVLRAVERCRTAALGGHRASCESCGHVEVRYHSCRNRHCPTCQSLEQHRWLEARRERILDAPYFHCVFTVPAALRAVCLANRRVMFDILFDAVRATLLAFAADPKWLGATPAISAVLHTWSRELVFHPHVHAIVSAGGWRAEQGRWVASRSTFLFPVKAMAKVFRGHVRGRVLDALANGTLVVDASTDPALRTALFETRWVVYAKPPFGGAHDVFAYLGRYTHRVGISNARLLAYDPAAVTFATKFGKSISLPPLEFLRRFLLHVLPKGFHKIRHFGLASASHVRLGTLARARDAIATRPVRTVARTRVPTSAREVLLALGGRDLARCARCEAVAMRREPLLAQTSPPCSATFFDSS